LVVVLSSREVLEYYQVQRYIGYMKILGYILIPSVLFFGLFFGAISSGVHDMVFDQGMRHVFCDGNWCSTMPDIACSVHCLTAGLGQSFGSTIAEIMPSILIGLVLLWLGETVVLFRSYDFCAAAVFGLPPPTKILLKTQKRE
jgi:hypothetical protein